MLVMLLVVMLAWLAVILPIGFALAGTAILLWLVVGGVLTADPRTLRLWAIAALSAVLAWSVVGAP